ncbi:MAG TPA: DUF3575 domain-containing protein [Dysgonamonadaceae bacterium]|jgi:hypothetical protein|nr:DUF3575 domain-containing protein [Dysgonamonadaceae bacterium]
MKKNIAIISVFLLISLFSLNAQQDLELTHRHEVKLNLGSSVFLAFPEVSYEYILSEDMTVGAAMGFGFDTENGDGYSFKTTPFLRWFFGRNALQPATGFFLEANGALGTQDFYRYNTTTLNDYNWVSESMFTAGLGLAVGWKYLSRNDWSGELFMGVGRNFVYDKNYDDVSLYSRIGVSIGKRF